MTSNSWNPGFPHVVEIPAPTPAWEDENWVSKRNQLHYQLTSWICYRGLVYEQDYLYFFLKPEYVLHYQFKDPAEAMIFKLTWL
jgi:hypothetical protein